jgi:hypothetical protein
MGKTKEFLEKIENEISDEEKYYGNNYIETVTIGTIYK